MIGSPISRIVKGLLHSFRMPRRYGFIDAEDEDNGYADYQAARDRIDSLTIK